MKPILTIFLTILIISPAFAVCKLDDNTACSIANFREPVSPTYQTKNNMNVRELSKSPTTKLQPLKRENPQSNFGKFTSSENKSNYNSSCQFGVCLQNRSTPLFQQPKQ